MIISAPDAHQITLTNEHLQRHLAESGLYGIHWLPYDPSTLKIFPTVNLESLATKFDQVGWERWIIVFDEEDQKVVGHLSLKGPRFDRMLHRCELAMGLEYPFWRQGLGDELLEEAIKLATSIPSVDWLDLRVLGCNLPAQNLYDRHQFEVVSRLPDFCRIDGQSVEDIFMTLAVTTRCQARR